MDIISFCADCTVLTTALLHVLILIIIATELDAKYAHTRRKEVILVKKYCNTVTVA